MSDLFNKFFDVVNRLRTIEWLVALFLGLLAAVRYGAPEGLLEDLLRPLTYFVGSLVATVLVVNAGKWGWRKWNPLTLTIEPYGSTEACLVVCPSLDGEYYGTGQILHPSLCPQRPFGLNWEKGGKKRQIRSGDKESMILSIVRIPDYPSSPPVLVICSESGDFWSIALRGEMLPLVWIHVRTEIRSTQSSRNWVNEYQFRIDKDFQFEIKEVNKPTTSHTVLGLA